MSTPIPVTKISSSLAATNTLKTVVKFENLSVDVDINKVATLINSLIGGVESYQYHKNTLGGCLDITFVDQNFASKALCMTGCFVHGTTTIMNSIAYSQNDGAMESRIDDRRNLYVLGLPFALTKAEFSNLFSHYGTVVHCVVLATVDNSSRRRGFVVMSTHAEAKLAMTSLSQTQFKGLTLDVSWAVVQRSKGFLDGGDRALSLDTPRLPSSPFIMSQRSPDASSMISVSNCEYKLGSLVLSLAPSPTLLVTDLPKLLFSQPHDLDPLLCPFGPVKTLSVVESMSSGSTSVLVEYGSAYVAREAKETLHGQQYAGYQLAAHFVFLKDRALSSEALHHDVNIPRSFDSADREPLLGCIDFVYPYLENDREHGYRAPPPSSLQRPRLCDAFNSVGSRYQSALKFGRAQVHFNQMGL